VNSPLSVVLGLRFGGTEAVLLWLAVKKRPKDFLRPRPEEDVALPVKVRGLVALGPIHPDVACGINIARAHPADLVRPGSCKPLNPHHHCHDRPKKRQCCLDDCV
jgi:hypothetical protein